MSRYQKEPPTAELLDAIKNLLFLAKKDLICAGAGKISKLDLSVVFFSGVTEGVTITIGEDEITKTHVPHR